ncbi:MAG: RNA 2',3'-cyclic phosphodiesterase [Phycisphaerales bacterium]|nr:RNA 2',3'-cyclic phosphodiesterase [Phycisphaerales bacterium]
MRCFVAIELPEEIRKRLLELQSRFGKLDRFVRWVHPDQIHLTVKFLGEVPDRQVSAVCAAAKAAAAASRPFEVEISGTGCFPDHGPVRVLWAGIPELPPPLLTVQQAMEKHCVELGFPRETRAFRPHLTLGRTREGASASMVRTALEREAGFVVGRFDVEALTVFQSVLQPAGATYSILAHARLGEQA